MFAIRGGYSLATSATPERTATVFTAPPAAVIHGFHVGGGVHLLNDKLDLDLGGIYSFANGHAAANPPMVIAGDYSVKSIIVSGTGTYRF